MTARPCAPFHCRLTQCRLFCALLHTTAHCIQRHTPCTTFAQAGLGLGLGLGLVSALDLVLAAAADAAAAECRSLTRPGLRRAWACRCKW